MTGVHVHTTVPDPGSYKSSRPVCHLYLARVALEYLADSGHVIAGDVDGYQNRTGFHLAFEGLGAGGWDAGRGQHRREVAGGMAGDFAELGGQRAGGHDWADAWQHHRDGGQDVTAQLPEHCRGSRIFQIGTRRRVQLAGQLAFFRMTASHHGNLIAADTRAVQCTRGKDRSIRAGEKSQDQGMWHRSYLTC